MNLYLTLKALHLISVVAWMAGLLYLPRIFVYHCEHMGPKRNDGSFQGYGKKTV